MIFASNLLASWSTEDEDVDDPSKVGVYVNAYDVKQYTNGQGDDACLSCALPYTNRGDSMLCPRCFVLCKSMFNED